MAFLDVLSGLVDWVKAEFQKIVDFLSSVMV
jgi:hypothetical protein